MKIVISAKILLLSITIVVFFIGPAYSAENSTNNSGDIKLVINEFMANNASSISDPHGDHDDWIEIYNYNDDAIDIGGKSV